MEKEQIVEAVRKRIEISKRQADRTVDAVFETISDALKRGNEVRLVGFGTFSVTSRAASDPGDPPAGERIKIAGFKEAKFKPGRRLREELMASFATKSQPSRGAEQESEQSTRPGTSSKGKSAGTGSLTSEEVSDVIGRTVELLGGRQVFDRQFKGPLDVHEQLNEGLPGEALTQLVAHVPILRHEETMERALGLSMRTAQRFKAAPKKRLSAQQSSRVWEFAHILAKATEVFGSRQEAENWLEQPAIALEQRRPIDLIAIPAGAKIVNDLLLRIEYGVYT